MVGIGRGRGRAISLGLCTYAITSGGGILGSNILHFCTAVCTYAITSVGDICQLNIYEYWYVTRPTDIMAPISYTHLIISRPKEYCTAAVHDIRRYVYGYLLHEVPLAPPNYLGRCPGEVPASPPRRLLGSCLVHVHVSALL